MTNLTNGQITTLKTWVVASVDPVVVDLRTRGATFELAQFFNEKALPAVSGWREIVAEADADEAPDYSTFDTLAAGKRDSWGFFLARPRNFSKNKVRKWITDVWGNATAGSNSEVILQAGVENITVAQNIIGGTVRTTGTVSALARNYVGLVTQDECAKILAP